MVAISGRSIMLISVPMVRCLFDDMTVRGYILPVAARLISAFGVPGRTMLWVQLLQYFVSERVIAPVACIGIAGGSTVVC